MANPISNNGTFPAADINGELNPGANKYFEVDSTSSEIATSKEIKDRFEEQEKKEKKKKDSMQTLKTTILISAAVVAVAGAAFAIAKKLREK
ncbi:hypothetical protein CCACVL1_11999 [Corchorus capsularis]|uniref:Uncharacterized protein n=1 Tax=Corchorus capsularis TaxID=210143 RepID=A0A1R3II52_COCAP|nr:hypothetical protein CCACVL1_11999 [Corchorus capsularis]